jgi:SNF2 family DNA or RNA helicase
MGGFGAHDLTYLEEVQQRWSAEAAGKELSDVLDLTQYGDRVIGIGRAEKVASPYLQKGKSENWLPAALLSQLGLDGELLSRWETSNHDHYEQFVTNIEAASANGQATARLPGPELDLELLTARRIATLWGERFKQRAPSEAGTSSERDVLLVAGNIDELDYKRDRGATIRQGLMVEPELPHALLPSTSLRAHQLQGVGWLQHLYRLSPHMTSGCVLADDMGLGKTLQLLSFIAWCLEQEPDCAPMLIVAPVSLLDNWEREMRHFLHHISARKS